MKVIPAIDLRNGQCVRLLQGDFDKQTLYSDNPLEVADGFAALGFSALHVVDLDGAESGEPKNRKIVEQIIRNTDFDIQLGGGIRSATDVTRWLDNGVSRCVVGSIAITDPDVVAGWLREIGSAKLVLALDVSLSADGVPMLATDGWTKPTELSLWDRVDRYLQAGVQHVLCTDISRDGAMSGPSLALYKTFMKRYPDVELQASGGVRDINDLRLLRAAGIPAAITGRALLDGRLPAKELSPFLRNG